MIRLLDACAKFLASRGMRYMFIDGIHGGDVGFRSLGKFPEPALPIIASNMYV